MKTKLWIAVLAAALLVCSLSAFFLLAPGEDAARAEIISHGRTVRIVDLATDQTFTVRSKGFSVLYIEIA